ncbi:MAG: hypothetical protein DCC71_25110, partial [Proteobacteria bacterium]
ASGPSPERARRGARRWPWVAALAGGLALRLPGLLFNGMYDLDQMILEWGADVAQRGIGPAFGENYGFLSYLAYGAAAQLAEAMPRFWWAPVKAMEICAELGVLAALLALAAPAHRLAVVAMFWLNPWFALHGAWHGFWEGPHVLAALLGVVCVARVRRSWVAWGALGFLVAASWMFKPQGLIQIGVPVGIFLGLALLRNGRTEVFWYVAGVLAFLALGTALLVADGAHPLAIPRNAFTAADAMPNLCNECLNLWRPVSVLFMAALGQEGPTHQLVLPATLLTVLQLFAAAVTLGAIAVYAWRLSPQGAPPRAHTLLLAMAFSSLVISSFGTMAHVNHGFTAAVLLIPFAAGDARLRRPWIALIAISLLAHLTTFGVGRPRVLPELYLDFDPARALVAGIEGAVREARELPLLQFRVQRFLRRWLPLEPTLTVLSLGQAVCAVALVRALFAASPRRRGEPA